MSKAKVVSTKFTCMLCGEEVRIEESVYVIHKRQRRDSYLDYDFILICEKCGDAWVGPLKDKIRRRFTNE